MTSISGNVLPLQNDAHIKPPEARGDCGETYAEKCEDLGCCCKVTIAMPWRFLWSSTKVVGNGIGAGLAFVNFLGLGAASVTVLGLTGCCKSSRDVGIALGTSALDNLRYTCIGVGSAVSTIITGIPIYFAKCCCKESVEDKTKRCFRCVNTNCIDGCKITLQGRRRVIREKTSRCCYFKLVQTLTGASDVRVKIERYVRKAAGSVVPPKALVAFKA